MERLGYLTPKEGVGRSNRLGDAIKLRGYSLCRSPFSVACVIPV